MTDEHIFLACIGLASAVIIIFFLTRTQAGWALSANINKIFVGKKERSFDYLYHIIELVILVLCAVGVYLLIAQWTPGIPPIIGMGEFPAIRTAEALSYGLILAGPFFLIRFCRNFGYWLLVIVGLPVLYGVYHYVTFSAPILSQMREELEQLGLETLMPLLALPSFTEFYVRLLQATLPFLGALRFIRDDFRWRVYIPTVLILTIVTDLMMSPFIRLPLGPFLLSSLALTFFYSVSMLLPRQRAATMQMMEPLETNNPVLRELSHAGAMLIVPIIMCVPLATGYNFVLARMVETISTGPDPIARSPAEINMMDVFGPAYFRKHPDRVPYQSVINRKEARNSGLKIEYVTDGELADPVSPELDKEIFNQEHLEILNRVYTANDTLAEKFYLADQANYSSSTRSEGHNVPSFLALREISRLLCYKAVSQSHLGMTEDSMESLESIFLVGGLMREGTLVEVMIGTAIRGIANGTAYNILWRVKDDPEQLAALCETLDDVSYRQRQSFPFLYLAQAEPGFWKVSPYFEIGIPSILRAHSIFYRIWYQFDQVQLAANLELFRIEQGAYPENLDQLVPEYMKHIPLDPFKGEPYLYSVTDGGFTLISEYDQSQDSDLTKGFPFPYAEEED